MKSVMQAYCIQKHMSGDYIGTLKLIMPCAAMPHNKYEANNDLIDAERVFIFAPVFVAISLSQGKFKNRESHCRLKAKGFWGIDFTTKAIITTLVVGFFLYR